MVRRGAAVKGHAVKSQMVRIHHLYHLQATLCVTTDKSGDLGSLRDVVQWLECRSPKPRMLFRLQPSLQKKWDIGQTVKMSACHAVRSQFNSGMSRQ